MTKQHKSHKPKLQDVHRAFLVREFACFATPKQAAEALRQEFGVEVTPQSAQHYDATSGAGARAARKWQELFDRCRTAFLSDVEKRVPEAYKAVRVKMLSRAANEYESCGNYMAMAKMLERIAKEMGNVYPNDRASSGKGRGRSEYQNVEMMSDAQLKEELRLCGFDPDA